jgi:hypothetical protein
MKRTRIYTDANLTKVMGPNVAWDLGDHTEPRWVQNQEVTVYMIEELGFTQGFMVYDGTLNRAGWWADPETLELYTGEGYRENVPAIEQANPPVKWAVQACAKLASGQANTWNHELGRWDLYFPSKFYYSKGEPGQPIFFDLEGHYWGGEAPVDDKINSMAQAIYWCKDPKVNQHSRVGAYGWPWGPPRKERASEFMAKESIKYLQDALDFANPCFYTVPTWETPRHWFESVDMMTAHLDRYYSWLPRIATINPTYQMYWYDDPRFVHLKPRHNEPIPRELWKKQLSYLTERDYELYIWTSGILLTDEIRKLLLDANRYQIDDVRTKPLL